MRTRKRVKLKIVILGPDGAGKTSVIQGLKKLLAQAGYEVLIRHLKPNIFKSQQGETISICPAPHSLPPRSTLFSLAKIFVWLFEEWYAHLFLDTKEALLICDRYYHDLLIDSKRYRYGGPRWAANLVGKLVQKPDLWVLLDASAEILQSRKREVPFEESSRQRQAYLAFIRGQRNHVIIDASQSLRDVTSEVESVILKAIAQKRGNRE